VFLDVKAQLLRRGDQSGGRLFRGVGDKPELSIGEETGGEGQRDGEGGREQQFVEWW